MNTPGHSSSSWDFRLLTAAGLLALIGSVAMTSTTWDVSPHLAIRHAIYILIGLLFCWAVGSIDYRRYADIAMLGYGMSLAALVLILKFGTVRLGASRWLSIFGMSIQPSEFAKLMTIWVLARYLAGQPRPLPLRVLGGSLAWVLPPMGLVFLQPDLGSSTIFGAIWLGMVWVAGISGRMLFTSAGLSITLLPVGWLFLKDYQRARLTAFLNPHADPLGTGYNIIQSTIAIGSGQWTGRGWAGGTQNQLRFVPERHSDFIFSVIGEEWGFLGTLIVVGVFGLLLFRLLRIAQETFTPESRLFAVGVTSWIAYQAIVNMGMVIGLLPVVGVPLPLLSYGGSAMVTLWVAVGLIQSVIRFDRR